jgi:hypothetical protein
VRFARIVFRIAGSWGVVLLTALYFVSEPTAPIGTAAGAQFYFGFLAVTMAWQLAFFVIASDPVRFRLMILPAIVEKFGYVVSLAVLYARNRLGSAELMTGVPDIVLGVLFIIAFVVTGRREGGVGSRR